MCDTLENNIYFAFPKNKMQLDYAIKAACLTDDIKVLPNGIKTSIG